MRSVHNLTFICLSAIESSLVPTTPFGSIYLSEMSVNSCFSTSASDKMRLNCGLQFMLLLMRGLIFVSESHILFFAMGINVWLIKYLSSSVANTECPNGIIRLRSGLLFAHTVDYICTTPV